MTITENHGEIIIRHYPFAKWIIGGVLAFIFGCLALSLVYFVYTDSSEGQIQFSAFLLIVIGFIIILLELKMICAPLIIVNISSQIQGINLIHRRFYGSKTRRFHFHQTNKFKSYKSKMNLSEKYYLALVLSNRKTMKLDIPIGEDKQQTVKFIKNLNKFIKSTKISNESANA